VLTCLALVGALAGCGDDPAAEEESAAPAAAASGALADCPSTIVVQSSWFPEAEHGAAYQLAGVDGTTDPETGSYTGEIGDTGVQLEIRAGGPFVGFQRVDSLMYQDDSIMFGFTSTTETIEGHATAPTVGVFAPYDRALDAIVYDPETVDLGGDPDKIAESGATLLALESNKDILQVLGDSGMVDEGTIDYSYDGSLSRFVTSEGADMLLGYATNEPYRLENETEQWMEQVDYISLSDMGWESYGGIWAVRPDTIESQSACLTALVPMIQQAQIDYLEDPAPVNELLVDIVAEQNTFWTMTTGHATNSVETMIDDGIVGNGTTPAYGDFDADRVGRVFDTFSGILAEDGRPVDDGLTADDIFDNQFIDSSLSWTAP
jgi:hypothetical protein